MAHVSANLLAVRERFDTEKRRDRYTLTALREVRLQCGALTAQLQALPYNGSILNSEPEAFTVLRLVWLIKGYIREFNRYYPLRWDEVHELYELKHALLTHIVCTPPDHPSKRWCQWELGLATDTRSALSVRLYFTGRSRWNTLVHWPLHHVPVSVQQLIRAATGSWPPPEYITYHPTHSSSGNK